jgi:DNA-binding transcriptional LysR family regulator
LNKFTAYQTFICAAEQGSFTAAARKLGMSASAITKMISRLEDDLSVRLFNRTTRKLALSEQGQLFFEQAQKIMREIDDAEAQLRQATTATVGTVRIVVPFLFGRLTLVPHLDKFYAKYPDVKLQIHFSDRPVDLIESGFDCGVHTGDMTDSASIRRQLTKGPLITAAAPTYLAHYGTPKTPEDLYNHNCLHGRFGLDWSFRSAQGTRQKIRVNGNLAVYNGDALREAAVLGLGIVQQTYWALQHDLKQGSLIQILKDYAIEGPSISVIYPARRHLPARVRAVITFLTEITSVNTNNSKTPSLPKKAAEPKPSRQVRAHK